MDGQKQTYEQFKADILQWKDAHREEYRRFAKMMADGNEVQYLAVCRAIFKQLPGIRREWQQSWCDDSTDGFRNIGLHFKENAVPGQIVELGCTPPRSTAWGWRLQFPDLPSLKSESAIRQAVGFLKTAKHIIKDGKDQMAPLVSRVTKPTDEAELFRSLVQEIKEITTDDEAETAAG